MAETKALTVREKSETLLAFVSERKANLEAAMCERARQYMTPDKLLDLLRVALTRLPALLDCTPESVLFGLMRAAETALDPSGKGGLAYLIPFRNRKTSKLEAEFIPGYKGVRLNLLRSGVAVKVEARVVYEDDKFEYQYGDTPSIAHFPSEHNYQQPDQVWNAIKAAYAIAWLSNGLTQFEVITKDELRRIRDTSKAGDQGPWNTWPDMMAKKSAVKRLGNALSVDPDSLAGRTLQVDDEFEAKDRQRDYVVDLGLIEAKRQVPERGTLDVNKMRPGKPAAEEEPAKPKKKGRPAKAKPKKDAEPESEQEPDTPPAESAPAYQFREIPPEKQREESGWIQVYDVLDENDSVKASLWKKGDKITCDCAQCAKEETCPHLKAWEGQAERRSSEDAKTDPVA